MSNNQLSTIRDALVIASGWKANKGNEQPPFSEERNVLHADADIFYNLAVKIGKHLAGSEDDSVKDIHQVLTNLTP